MDTIVLELTEKEAEQLQFALDFLIEDSQDETLIVIANKVNEKLLEK